MKLTKSIRDAFVRAVMQDVPQVNYTDEMHQLVQADNLKRLPPEVRKLAESSKLRSYLKVSSFYFGHGISSTAVYTQESYSSYTPSPECLAKLTELKDKTQAQLVQRQALESKVRSAIEACSTLRQAKERLPEFEKYLPDEIEKSKNLPAIANLVADLTQLGWPKSKTASTKPAVTAA